MDDEQVFSSDEEGEDKSETSGYQASFTDDTHKSPASQTSPQTKSSPKSPSKSPSKSSSKSPSKSPGDVLREDYPDSEPVYEVIDPRKVYNARKDSEADTEGEFVYDATQDKPNPGEVMDDPETIEASKPNETCLEITTTLKSSEQVG